MRLFECPVCGNTLYFENRTCLKCRNKVVFNPKSVNFEVLEPEKNRFACRNRKRIGCNWIAIENEACLSCSLTNRRPKSKDVANHVKHGLLEGAKRRLIYQLMLLKLPINSKAVDPELGLEFDFLSKNNKFGLLTGHANGTITIILAEADAVHREQLRKQLSEPYRTLLGHFRHEIGHYYWNILFKKGARKPFRKFFGDERLDYSSALQLYYDKAPKKKWRSSFISKYASSHPWEDWAETWAHYLHLMDTLETAHYFGVSLDPILGNSSVVDLKMGTDPYLEENFEVLFQQGIALTHGVNSLNRSMGIPDIYPFVIPPPVFDKLKFIHSKLYGYGS